MLNSGTICESVRPVESTQGCELICCVAAWRPARRQNNLCRFQKHAGEPRDAVGDSATLSITCSTIA